MAEKYSTPAVPKQPILLRCPSIDDLRKETNSEEYLFANLAHQLMCGKDVDGCWLKLRKLNDPEKKNDDAIYKPDYGLSVDGLVLGYLDPEVKVNWHSGGWPYPKTNVPKYPMGHWQNGRFTGRLTNKLIAFKDKPQLSFWIGMRTDWRACWIMKATSIFEYGRDAEQGTRYSECSLPVIEVPNKWATLLDSADAFTHYIITAYRSGICQSSIPF